MKLLTPNSRCASKNREVAVERKKKRKEKRKQTKAAPDGDRLCLGSWTWRNVTGASALPRRSVQIVGSLIGNRGQIWGHRQDWDKLETTTQQWQQNFPLQYLLSSTCQTLLSLWGAPVFSTPSCRVSNVYFRPGTVCLCSLNSHKNPKCANFTD